MVQFSILHKARLHKLLPM